MTERSERFRARRAKLESGDGNAVPPLADAELVGNMLSQAIDWAQIDSVSAKPPVFDYEVTDEEVAQCLLDLDQALTRQKYDALFDGIKDTLIDQLLGPLHLSRSELGEADRDFRYKGEEYRSSTTRKSQMKKKSTEDGKVKDEYTGKMLPPERAEVDHITPLKDFHDRGGFMLNAEEKKNAGKDPNNLAITDRSINRSKGAKSLTEIKEQENLDGRRIRHPQERAERSVSANIPKGFDFAKRAASDGVKAGTLQAKQQLLALLISELISAVFFEVKDALTTLDRGRKSGSDNLTWSDNLNTWLMSLTKRLDRVKSRLLSRWRDLAAALGTGWLSGFFSNTIIPVVLYTVKAVRDRFVKIGYNLVRIIREGFLSIMKAIAVLINPPEGMSSREAAHEASKVLTTGLVVTGGVLAGEAIANVWSGFPFGNIFASVLGGLISGLGSLFVVFMLDKLDLFGVVLEERHAFIMGSLEGRISEATIEIENILSKSRLK